MRDFSIVRTEKNIKDRNVIEYFFCSKLPMKDMAWNFTQNKIAWDMISTKRGDKEI